MDHLGGSFDLDQTLSQFQMVQTGLALALMSGAGWSSVALLTCLVVGWLSAQAMVGGEDGTGSHGCRSPVRQPGLFTVQSQEVTIVNGSLKGLLKPKLRTGTWALQSPFDCKAIANKTSPYSRSREIDSTS